MITEEIYCCGCGKNVTARLTTGVEIYPSRDDLHLLPFWKCDTCKNYVGCHHKVKSDPTKPLGNIPTKAISDARKHIHKLIDPLWRNHAETFRARGWIYRWLSQKIGRPYHTAEIASVEEAREIYAIARTIKKAEDCRDEFNNNSL